MTILILFILIVLHLSLGFDPTDVIITLAIDAGSTKIQFEAFRLLRSIEIFGGSMKLSKINVCVSLFNEESAEIRDKWVQLLHLFGVNSIVFSKRYSPPEFSPTLNKLCSFEPLNIVGNPYILYLDADIFIAKDPYPRLADFLASANTTTKYADIHCGRPWSIMQGIEDFVSFIGFPSNMLNRNLLLPTFDGGVSFYGMCNTGVYLLRADGIFYLFNFYENVNQLTTIFMTMFFSC